MALDLAVVLRAAGPLLFVVLGVGLVAWSRGRREPILVGATVGTIGAMLVASNTILAGGGAPFVTLATVFAALAILSAAAFVGHVVATTPPRQRVWSILLVLASTASLWIAYNASYGDSLSAYAAAVPPEFMPQFTFYFEVAYIAIPIHAVLVGLLALRATGDARALPASAGVAAALGILWGIIFAGEALAWAEADFGRAPLIMFVILGVGALLWLAPAIVHESRAARGVALAILAGALVGMLRVVQTGEGLQLDPYAPQGITRLVGWAILARTALTAGWLDMGFMSRHRAGLATTALAALFIVAQLAEQLLNAELGLLVGSVVAGALFFAANPIQRAMESVLHTRQGEPPPSAEAAVAARGSGGTQANEAAYVNALRLALRDRLITSEEAVQLHDLAERLGIGAGRAHALFVEVTRENAK